jgi:hypothetical protein
MSKAICCLSDIGPTPDGRPDVEFLGRVGSGILIYIDCVSRRNSVTLIIFVENLLEVNLTFN